MKQLNQKGIAFIPILIWMTVILFTGTAAVKEGLIKVDLSGNGPLIQKVETPTPSPDTDLKLIISSPDPSSTPIPTPKNVKQAYVDPDPVTTCNNPNCGPIQIPKSECSDTVGYVCCQISNKWTWYSSRTQCSKDQQGSTTSDADPIITCNSKTGQISVKRSICASYTDCPDGRGGYIFESQDSCKQRWNRIGQDLTIYTKEYWDAKLEQDRLKTQLGIQEMQNKANQAIQDMNNTANSVSQPTFKVEPLPIIKSIPPPPFYGIKCSELEGYAYIKGGGCDP